MAAGTQLLTLEEFRLRYADAKPYYEYWFGEAIQKAVPTTLHSLLQKILMYILDQAGYRSAAEVELRIDPNWQPKPDVLASVSALERPYPTQPVEIVIEVLSPTDALSLVHEKCRNYQRIGCGQIFVFDPEFRHAWEWSRERENLERLEVLRLGNGRSLALADVWKRLDEELQ